MEHDDVNLDDSGVPLLDTPVDLEQLAATPEPATPQVDLSDQEEIDRLLHDPAVRQMLDDLAEDLQKTITLKLETALREEITRLVHQAAEQSAPKIAEDINLHLQLAVPELLAEIARRCKR